MSARTSSIGSLLAPQVSSLFDFPTPPTEFPELTPHPELVSAGEVFNRRTSAASADQALSPDAATYLRSKPSQQRSVGILLQNFKRISKSTTSLPTISGYASDAFGLSDYSLSGNGDSTEETKHPPTCIRGARSHHNLQQAEESPFLSQSLFSITSRCEPMPDVADLLTPIENRSYESDMGKSTGTIMLVSHTHAPSTALDAEQQLHVNQAPPQLLHSALSSGEVHYQIPRPMPRKQVSMSQVGIRQSNRNSMFISGALLPAVDMDEGEELHHQSQSQKQPSHYQSSLGSRLNKCEHRTSRYLYDVPASGGVQGTLSKALNWSQRIGHGSPRRSKRASSLAVDQHKIYDIYKESPWHNSTHISQADPEPTASMPFDLEANSSSAARLHDLSGENQFRTSNAVDGTASSRLKSLHAMASSGAPWRMLRSIKLGAPLRDKSGEWDGSSTYTGSVYSDSSNDSVVSPLDIRRQASQPVISKVVRKPSVLHTFAKRAGLGLVRRSVSICKIVSGTRVASNNDGSCEYSQGSYKCNSSTLSSSSSSASVASSKHNKPRRVLDAMRQVKNRLVRSLKPVRKHDETNTCAGDDNDDGDNDDCNVVSAYPTDSAPGTDLYSYLSLSAIHSPEPRASANLDDSSSETHVASASESGSSGGDNDVGSKYAPPKRPSYLGLHRRTAANVAQAPAANNPFRQAPPPAALATPTARLRPTQFKSPFTTLPYGAYAQLNQAQVQHR
ncbi:hypothetical protein GGF44_000452 [Coemansia sp. RSA 1694]|nr:hypothetical protein GGF44_000452 [Coemansia sp. RSA 1694]